MKHWLLFFIATLTFLSTAQEAKIKTEIVTIALDEFVEGKFFHNGKEITEFSANSTGIGEMMRYEGSSKFVLRNAKEEFSQDTPPTPAAWVELPADSDRVLLACVKSKDKPLRLVAYDIGSAKVSSGDYRVFNFSRSAISVILGSEKIAINAGANQTISNNKWKKEITEIDVLFGMVKDQEVRPVYSSQWGHRPGRRNYIFIFDSPLEYNPLHICRYYDIAPRPAEKAIQ